MIVSTIKAAIHIIRTPNKKRFLYRTLVILKPNNLNSKNRINHKYKMYLVLPNTYSKR
ncbi:hypothetical protein FACS1894218_3410 [Bacilli bacterium]|nr:hypothetical protein FACS1894218_3410 [Bacilli bacterium]